MFVISGVRNIESSLYYQFQNLTERLAITKGYSFQDDQNTNIDIDIDMDIVVEKEKNVTVFSFVLDSFIGPGTSDWREAKKKTACGNWSYSTS